MRPALAGKARKNGIVDGSEARIERQIAHVGKQAVDVIHGVGILIVFDCTYAAAAMIPRTKIMIDPRVAHPVCVSRLTHRLQMEQIMQFFRALGFLAGSASLALPAPALAHVHVVSSTPAAAATVSNVRSVTITFNETFIPALSGLEVVMTGMPGMDGHHPAMKIAGVKVTPSADSKSMVATVPRPLAAGVYNVNWHAVGDDTHRMTGTVRFTVR